MISRPNSGTWSTGGNAGRLFALCSLCLFLFIGCFTTPDRVAYTVGTGTTVTVEEALTLWDGYVQQRHPGPAVEQKVKAAFEKYQLADVALLKAGKAMLADPTSADAQSAWQLGEAALAAAANDLYGLLKSSGLKLP